MSAIPKKVTYNFAQKEEEKPQPAAKPAPKKGNDFFIVSDSNEKKVEKPVKEQPKEELFQRMDVDIKQIMKQQEAETQPTPAAPAPTEKKPRKKRKMTQARLDQLARMRAKRSENCRKRREEKAKGKMNAPVSSNTSTVSKNSATSSHSGKMPNADASAVSKPTAVKPAKTDAEKAAKRARKRAEMEEYFNHLYEQKEKVRLANKAKKKKEKAEVYKKMVADGIISFNKPKTSTPNPKPYVAPIPSGRKKLRTCADGSIEIYYEN